jgi:hypothetical protein
VCWYARRVSCTARHASHLNVRCAPHECALPTRAIGAPCILTRYSCAGDRISHPARGDGAVLAIDRSDARPTTVQFDNGERHSYSDASATKLLLVERPAAKTLQTAKLGMQNRISGILGKTDRAQCTPPRSGVSAQELLTGAVSAPQIPTATAVELQLPEAPKGQLKKHEPASSPRKILTPLEPFSIGDDQNDAQSSAAESDACTRPSSEASAVRTPVDLVQHAEFARSVEPIAILDRDAVGSLLEPQLPGTPSPERGGAGAEMSQDLGLIGSVRGSVRRLNTMGSFHVERQLRSLRVHLNAQKAIKTARYVASLPHRGWWWLASWASEGQFDVRVSPLIEDSKQKFWSMVTTLLLRQYLTGLVFGLLVAEPTCDLQLLALMALTLLHIVYLGFFQPMIDMVSLFFEVVTLSLQLTILVIFYAQFKDQPIDKSIPLILLVCTVFFNVIFHFPASHYGLERHSSLRIVAGLLLSRARDSAKSRLYASSDALRSGALAASSRLFGSRGASDSESDRHLESLVESTELPAPEQSSPGSSEPEHDAEQSQPSPAAATPGDMALNLSSRRVHLALSLALL